MASTIILSDNGASSGSAGIKTTGGNDGVLLLQTTTTGGTATTALTIDTSQNVGVGVTPSAWQATSKAYEIGSGSTSQGAWSITASGYMDVFRNAYIGSGGTAYYKLNGYAQQYRQSADGSHSWGVAASGTAGAAVTFTQAMTLSAGGNLGIGTSSPSAKLNVSGTTILGTGVWPTGTMGLNDSRAGILSSTENAYFLVQNTNGTVAANNGGELRLGATATTNTANAVFAAVGGYKENATSGSYTSYLALKTMDSGGTLTEQARIDSAGLFKCNSGYGSVAAAYGCRAWLNFNGTGTVAIRASGNVTSITDNGVGDYTINFTNAMPDANYAWSAGGNEDSNSTNNSTPTYKTTTTYQLAASLRILTYFNQRPTGSSYNNGVADFSIVNVNFFR